MIDMQAEFVSLVNAARHGGIAVSDRNDNYQKIDRDIFSDHVFDFGDFKRVPSLAVVKLPQMAPNAAYPFASFWFIYRTTNPPLGHIINALHVEHTTDGNPVMDTVRLSLFMRHEGSFMPTDWQEHPPAYMTGGGVTCNEPRLGGPTASDEYIPEFFAGMALLQTRVTATADFGPVMIAANIGRAKARTVARAPLKQFIRVTGQMRAASTGNTLTTPTGFIMPPHDRRGHVRRLRDGRIIPIRASQIHGGSSGPQTYRVAV